MWSYYGAKTNIIHLYPKPKYNQIIEPFAGSARYALKYFEKDVLLVDKYEVVIKIWSWLQKCSPKDILNLPKLKKGQRISDCYLSEEEKLFLGMLAGVSSVSPRDKVSMFSSEQNGYPNKMKRIADQLYKIKHRQFRCWDYTTIENCDATWFIDPPYQFGGNAYVHNKIDYIQLNKWCMERIGQVIVCENMKSNWMYFKPLTKSRGSNQLFTTEAIWTNEKTQYDNEQLKLAM